MTLSILICHLSKREVLLERLMACLRPQIEGHEAEVEIVVDTDDGEVTTGAKRNRLLAAAQGDYVAFVDDDDLVASNYVELILDAVKTHPDTVGIRIKLIDSGEKLRHISTRSVRYPEDTVDTDFGRGKLVWFPHELQEIAKLHPANLHHGPPTHLNPTRRDLAMLVGYPDLTWKEDTVYAAALYSHLKTEVLIDQPIYLYYPSDRVRHEPAPKKAVFSADEIHLT